jgi:hypothetical protein
MCRRAHMATPRNGHPLNTRCPASPTRPCDASTACPPARFSTAPVSPADTSRAERLLHLCALKSAARHPSQMESSHCSRSRECIEQRVVASHQSRARSSFFATRYSTIINGTTYAPGAGNAASNRQPPILHEGHIAVPSCT